MFLSVRIQIIVFLNILLVCGAVATDLVPSLINYQGRLTNAGGAPLTNGAYALQFRIWGTASGTEALVWAREYDVTLVEGHFNVILGGGGRAVSAPPTPAVNDIGYAFGAPERYVGLTVVSNPTGRVASPVELAPRQRILSAPYALQAERANIVVNGRIDATPIGQITPATGSFTNLTASRIETSGLRILGSAIAATGTNGNLALDAAGTGQLMNASLPMFACRAWVNFDGTSVTNVMGEDRCTIRASGNVSKVVRHGMGDFTVHFATPMPDSGYAVVVTGDGPVNGAHTLPFVAYSGVRDTYTPISVAVAWFQDESSGARGNPKRASVVIYR